MVLILIWEPREKRRHPPRRRRGKEWKRKGYEARLFYDARTSSVKGLAPTIKEDMDTIIDADRLGYDEAWIGEHYTIPWGEHTRPRTFHSQSPGADQEYQAGDRSHPSPTARPADAGPPHGGPGPPGGGTILFRRGDGGCAHRVRAIRDTPGRAPRKASKSWTSCSRYGSPMGDLDYKGKFHHIKAPEPWPEIGLSLYAKPFTKPHPPIAVACSSRNSPTADGRENTVGGL